MIGDPSVDQMDALARRDTDDPADRTGNPAKYPGLSPPDDYRRLTRMNWKSTAAGPTMSFDEEPTIRERDQDNREQRANERQEQGGHRDPPYGRIAHTVVMACTIY